MGGTDVIGLTAGQIAEWVVIGIVAISGIIQISPIKINPWSWLAKMIGRAINAEVIEKVDKLESDLETMKNQAEENNAKSNRSDILRFGDELRIGIKHSKESFDNILGTISDYDNYCAEHKDFKNKITEINEKYISDTYDKCLRDNSFL